MALRRRTGCLVWAALAALLSLGSTAPVFADGDADADALPTLVVFYQAGCGSCEQLDEFLAPFEYLELPASAVARYDISDPEAVALQGQFLAAHKQGKFQTEPPGAQIDVDSVDYPLVFIGGKIVSGMTLANERTISDAIVRCYREECTSPMEIVFPPIPWTEILRLAAFAGLALLLIFLQPL